MDSNNEATEVVAVSYVADEDNKFCEEETPTPIEGVPIESASD